MKEVPVVIMSSENIPTRINKYLLYADDASVI